MHTVIPTVQNEHDDFYNLECTVILIIQNEQSDSHYPECTVIPTIHDAHCYSCYLGYT